MMDDNNAVQLEGYRFVLTEFNCTDATATVAVNISGNGQGDADMTSWAIEVSPDGSFDDGIDIVSCEKRRGGCAWVPAAAQKTVYEMSDDIGINGVLIEEYVGKEKDDPGIEFRIELNGNIERGRARVAYITSDAVYQSIEGLRLGSSAAAGSAKLWRTPIEKSFCLYIVIPDGYKPKNACKANISITKRGLFLAREEGVFDIDGIGESMTAKAYILGSIKIIASIPVKSCQACGDGVYATACDCFELNETIGYTAGQDTFNMRDISICPKEKSFDLTLLNSHCGKSVYRLDGKYVVDCKKCLNSQV